MKSNLSKLVLEGKPRFEFDKKKADIVVGMQEGGSKEVLVKILFLWVIFILCLQISH